MFLTISYSLTSQYVTRVFSHYSLLCSLLSALHALRLIFTHGELTVANRLTSFYPAEYIISLCLTCQHLLSVLQWICNEGNLHLADTQMTCKLQWMQTRFVRKASNVRLKKQHSHHVVSATHGCLGFGCFLLVTPVTLQHLGVTFFLLFYTAEHETTVSVYF